MTGTNTKLAQVCWRMLQALKADEGAEQAYVNAAAERVIETACDSAVEAAFTRLRQQDGGTLRLTLGEEEDASMQRWVDDQRQAEKP